MRMRADIAATRPERLGYWAIRLPLLSAGRGWIIAIVAVTVLFQNAPPSSAQEDRPASNSSPHPVKPQTLDRVIAVVNNQVILESDLDLEMRISHLLPIEDRAGASPTKALERLTTRALIEQQILQEDPHGMDVATQDVEASLAELRPNLPGCKRHDCTTAAGWAAYLKTLGLDPERVDDYWSHRMAVLRFIERRFRSGIRIAPEEIEKYYRETLVPVYAKPEEAPPLDKVSPRIQEILLQQRVNALLNDWLKSLQDQGRVEILDPSLAGPDPPSSEPAPEPTPGKGGSL
jgi:peptidyl-prolyl cis-trans isomerase SurA